jgi:hypothetical protein
MQRFDFYSLPRSLQDRFIESTQGVAVPLPIALRISKNPARLVWLAASLIFIIAWVAVGVRGFGDLNHSAALGGPTLAVVFVLLALCALGCAGRAYVLSLRAAHAPFVAGDYVFPSGIIQVSGSTIVVHDASAVTAEQQGSLVTFVIQGGGKLALMLPSADEASEAVRAFREGKERWLAAKPDDALERARLYCLCESGVPNPLAPTRPHPKPPLAPVIAVCAGVVVLAGLLGSGLALYRDTASEQALYQSATQKDSVEAYTSYLARGGKRPEVGAILLPRARLKQAIADGSIGAVIAFARENQGSKIQPEIDAALRAALLKELEVARKSGTLAALRDLQSRYEQVQLIAPELKAAQHAVYEAAYQSYLAQSAGDKALDEFVGHLLTYAETHGPRVEVRFFHDFPQDPQVLDSIVKKNEKYFLGARSLPSQYFLGAPAREREKALGERIVSKLSEMFPKDVLEFHLAPLPEKENEPPAEVTGPTLTISHKETLSGGFVGGAPKSMYLGATVRMDARFQLPSDRSHEYHFGAWKNPSYAIGEEKPTEIPKVYGRMMDDAFEQFFTEYLRKWSKKK